MKTKLLALVTAIILVTGTSAAGAQETPSPPPSPLLMLINGEDIWSSFPPGTFPVQLTASGYTDRPVLSPDASQVAYKVIDRIGIAALQATGGLVSELPSNLQVRSLATGAVTEIAAQPPGATFAAGQPAVAVVRSAPSWSPDGTALAWTEDAAPENVRRLMVYSFATGQTQTLADDLPLQAGFQQTLPVRWGEGGIAVKSVTAPESGEPGLGANVETIYVYAPDGTLLSSTQPQPAQGEYVYEFVWIDDGGAARVAVIYSSGRWEMIDPGTGSISPLTGTPELYSRTTPDGLAVRFGTTTMPDAGLVFTWRVGDTPLAFTGPLEWITISPAGDALAYAEQGVGFIWQDGTTTPVQGTDPFYRSVSEITWGPTGWRIRAG